VFLSKDYWGHQHSSVPPNLRVVVRRGDIKLSDESNQERLHLDYAIQTPLLGVPGSEWYKRRSTHATRHPMQFLTPPENVELGE